MPSSVAVAALLVCSILVVYFDGAWLCLHLPLSIIITMVE